MRLQMESSSRAPTSTTTHVLRRTGQIKVGQCARGPRLHRIVSLSGRRPAFTTVALGPVRYDTTSVQCLIKVGWRQMIAEKECQRPPPASQKLPSGHVKHPPSQP